MGYRNCRLSLPSNHNLRYISYSYNYKHQRASTLDGSIAPATHRSIEDSIEETYARRQRQQPVNRPDSTRLISMGRSWPQIDRSPYPPSPSPLSLFPSFRDRKSANDPRGVAKRGVRRRAYRTRRKSTLGPLIKRARVYASHDHHHHRHHHLPPPSLPRRERGVEKRSIKSLVYGRPHSSATPFLQHILQPSPLLLRHSATLPGRPTCSFHPHQPLPRRGGGQRPLSTRSRVCRSAARWRWSARKGD